MALDIAQACMGYAGGQKAEMDSFAVNLQDVQAVAVVPATTTTPELRLSLLDKFSIETTIGVRAAAASTNDIAEPSPRMLVQSKLPLLSFQLDRQRVRVLSRIQAALTQHMSVEENVKRNLST